MFKTVYVAVMEPLQKYPAVRWLKERVKFELRLRRKLKRQLSYSAGKRPAGNGGMVGRRILIPLIETSHYQHLQLLILAKALEMRGAQIKVLVCGSRLSGCELKNVRNSDQRDPCLSCRFNRRYLLPMFGLDVVTLADLVPDAEAAALKREAEAAVSQFPETFLFEGVDLVPMVNDSVIRYYYGATAEDAGSLRSTRQEHLFTAMVGMRAAKRLETMWHPDIVLNNMFVYSAWEPYGRYFEERLQRQTFLLSLTQYNFRAVVLNIFDIFKSDQRYLRFREHRGGKYLDDREREELISFFSARTSGSSDIFQQLKFFDKNPQNCEKLSIDRNKRNVFLFSNIYWDVGMAETGRLFKDVIEWVLESVAIAQKSPDIHLYIKTHPGEKYDSAKSLKGIADFIYERFPILPDNVTIIYPDLKINTYDLFPYIDLGIVFNGTVGIEMMLEGIPIVVTAKAPYSRLGLAGEPESIGEYASMIRGETEAVRPARNEVELFCYFYFIKVRIPWNLTDAAYNAHFTGYSFDSLDDLETGKNRYLNHLCNCILNPGDTVVEGW